MLDRPIDAFKQIITSVQTTLAVEKPESNPNLVSELKVFAAEIVDIKSIFDKDETMRGVYIPDAKLAAKQKLLKEKQAALAQPSTQTTAVAEVKTPAPTATATKTGNVTEEKTDLDQVALELNTAELALQIHQSSQNFFQKLCCTSSQVLKDLAEVERLKTQQRLLQEAAQKAKSGSTAQTPADLETELASIPAAELPAAIQQRLTVVEKEMKYQEKFFYSKLNKETMSFVVRSYIRFQRLLKLTETHPGGPGPDESKTALLPAANSLRDVLVNNQNTFSRLMDRFYCPEVNIRCTANMFYKNFERMSESEQNAFLANKDGLSRQLDMLTPPELLVKEPQPPKPKRKNSTSTVSVNGGSGAGGYVQLSDMGSSNVVSAPSRAAEAVSKLQASSAPTSTSSSTSPEMTRSP